MLNNTNFIVQNLREWFLIKLYVLDYEKSDVCMNYYFKLCKREKIILLTLEMECYCLIGGLLKHFEH